MLSTPLSIPGMLTHATQTPEACNGIQHQRDDLARLLSISGMGGSCSLCTVAAEAAHKSLHKWRQQVEVSCAPVTIARILQLPAMHANSNAMS